MKITNSNSDLMQNIDKKNSITNQLNQALIYKSNTNLELKYKLRIKPTT